MQGRRGEEGNREMRREIVFLPAFMRAHACVQEGMKSGTEEVEEEDD